MFKKGEIIELYIDNLVYEGEGIGKYEGITVFVPDTAPGDKIKAKVISVKKNYARALVEEILEPSPHRIKPVCGLAKVCGGCQWQYIDYEEQLRAKKQIIKESFAKIAHIDIPVNDVIKSDCITEYRCKIQYPVQQTKVSKRILAGYYKKASHEVVNIKYCPVQPAIINDITEFLRTEMQKLDIPAYNEKTGRGLIRHLVYRYSQTNRNAILTIVVNSHIMPDKLAELARAVMEKFKEVTGIFVNYNTSATNVIMGKKTEPLIGSAIEEVLEGKKFKISAESFFQINPSTAVKMFNTVRKMVEERIKEPSILDVYAGVGTFSIWLKDLASHITAIEENPHAIEDFRENLKLNEFQDNSAIEIIEGNADNVLGQLVKEDRSFDVTILDPPRKGCSAEALNSAIALTKEFIIYVSCNPATLARDIGILKEHGFIPEYVQPIDMFCHTYHIESIVVIKKQVVVDSKINDYPRQNNN